MLQRRIGMIWTSSGWAVCVSPRANSLRERALRLRVLFTDPQSIASGCRRGRLRGAQALDVFADLERSVEDRPDGNETEEVVTRDRGESGRRDASALAAVRRSAELARRD